LGSPIFDEGVFLMPRGKIKRLVADRGIGFISTGGRQNVFFHQSAVDDWAFEDLREGQTVEYEVGDNGEHSQRRKDREKGPRAYVVKPV
jgi:CspA family cold shock protein